MFPIWLAVTGDLNPGLLASLSHPAPNTEALSQPDCKKVMTALQRSLYSVCGASGSHRRFYEGSS